MSMNRAARSAFIKKIITQMGENPEQFNAGDFARREGISIQSVYRYLKSMEENRVIQKKKAGRKNVYQLREESAQKTLALNNLSEDAVWKTFVEPFFSSLSAVPKENMSIAFTEMLNNAIDHSGGNSVEICLCRDAYQASVLISDDGIGIFKKIADAMGLEEKSFAVLELAKGKFTTDPESHTGEGVFFSSKMMDDFAIVSDGIVFLGPTSSDSPWVSTTNTQIAGTTVFMRIRNDHEQSAKEVYDAFTQAPEDYGFSKTVVPVRLLEYGDEKPLVISRSQAKRLMVRFERFENIVLDFEGIDSIGQGFADELFRVFVNQHPGTKLMPVNCSAAVKQMIQRVQNS